MIFWVKEGIVMSYSIQVHKTKASRLPETDLDNIVFGRIFSDHMLVADYYEGDWQNVQIMPFQNLSLSPATTALHYGQEIFEGMKAYKDKDHVPVLFRPDENWNRLNTSAHRMSMPTLPREIFMNGLRELLSIDKGWIPTKEGSSLYIRPFMFASDEYLGVKASDTYKFIIFLSPVNAYYPEPIKVKVDQQYARAVKGGVGYAKAGGNYGASLYPAKLGNQEGYSQLIWTDAFEHRYIEESGTMNIFFQLGNTFVTPELDGTILQGITRDSVIKLLQDEGYQVEERPVSVDEVLEAYRKGHLNDVFGTGTAAVIAHIIAIGYQNEELELPPVENRTISNHILKRLKQIQKRQVADPFKWVEEVEQIPV